LGLFETAAGGGVGGGVSTAGTGGGGGGAGGATACVGAGDVSVSDESSGASGFFGFWPGVVGHGARRLG